MDQTPIHNPFMLMLHPEIVVAAMERSENLSRLNRHLCRPLDRPTPTKPKAPEEIVIDDDNDETSDAAEH